MHLLQRLAAAPLAVALLIAGSTAQANEFAILESAPGLQLIAAVDAMHAGDLMKAEALFTLAIQRRQLAPEGTAHAYFNRGLVRQRQGKLQKAVSDYNIAIASGLLSPQSQVDAHYNRGLAWRQLGKLDEAINDFTRALELNPRFAHAYYSRALGLAAKGHYILALADFDKALKHGYPQAHKPWYGKALVHLARGERELAEAALRRVLKIAPKFAPAKQRLAWLQGKGGAPAQRMADIVPSAGPGGVQHAAAAPREEVVELAPMQVAQAPEAGRRTASSRLAMASAMAGRGTDAAARESSAPVSPAAAAARGVKSQSRPVQTSKRASRQKPVRKRQDRIAGLLQRQEARPARQPATATGTISGSTGGVRAAASLYVPVAFDAGIPSTGMAIPKTGRWGTPLNTASVSPPARKTAQPLQPSAKAQQPAGRWAIQLASESSERGAWRKWRRLRAKVAALVPSAQARVMRASVKGQVRYRLRLVGLADRKMALARCAALKARGISCYVVRLR